MKYSVLALNRLNNAIPCVLCVCVCAIEFGSLDCGAMGTLSPNLSFIYFTFN